MIFKTLPVADTLGSYLAHSLGTSQGRIAKGTLIDAQCVQRLQAAGIAEVLVARLEPSDVHEDTAATRIADALAGDGVRPSSARTGRVNLHATPGGLCHFDRQALIAANSIDEGITIATVEENQWVPAGRMVATIKIIPYGVPRSALDAVIDQLGTHRISVHPPTPKSATLIQTILPSSKPRLLDKTRRVTEQRLHQRDIELCYEYRCLHSVDVLSEQLKHALQQPVHWILLIGASAISDRRDVIPRAIEQAGGTVTRYGIAVDPGNLLLLGHIDHIALIGLPGCARSPRHNGLDLVLDRLACNLPLTNAWLNSLCIGGLLAENLDRPAPRVVETPRKQVGAILLAAGSSRRAGDINKLLFPYQGLALISHSARTLTHSRVARTVAVTGFEQEKIQQALSPLGIECVHNAGFDSGMASSLISGVSQLLALDAVLIYLADMPKVSTHVVNQLIDAFLAHPDKGIFIPVFNNKRGHPVLFSKAFFDSLLSLQGDHGAKILCQQYPAKVLELPVDCEGVLQDYDTPEALESLNGG